MAALEEARKTMARLVTVRVMAWAAVLTAALLTMDIPEIMAVAWARALMDLRITDRVLLTWVPV